VREARVKEEREARMKLMAEEHWERYFKVRTDQQLEAYQDILKEGRKDAEWTSLPDIMANVEDFLSETNLSVENRTLLKNSVVVLMSYPNFEDIDSLRSAHVDTRIFSLVSNAAVDLTFKYHMRARWASIEFVTGLAYAITSPVAEKPATRLFEKHTVDRIPT